MGQELKPVKIDSMVTVSLPEAYNTQDTLGQQVMSANGEYGYMVVIKAESAKDNKPLEKEKDLNKVMENYVADVKAQYKNASAQNVRDTTVGKLKATSFTLESDPSGNGEIQKKHFVILYTQPATYTFEYAYPDARGEVIGAELKTFLSSIKVSPELQRTDQYLSNAKGMSQIQQIALFGGGGLLLIGLVVYFVNRNRTPQLA